MEPHRHSCVLPSNAPALPDISLTSPVVSTRVLQERSGNRRHDYTNRTWKHDSPSPTENSYLHASGSYFTGNIESEVQNDQAEEEIDKETAKLIAQLFEVEEFKVYRERQPKDDEPIKSKKKEEHRWPDHLEYVFIRACVRYRPMPRNGLIVNGERMGRNELIAAELFKCTGEKKDRKKVSSHLQVVKGKLKGRPDLLRYFGKPKEDKGGKEAKKLERSRHADSRISGRASRYSGTSRSNQHMLDSYGYSVPAQNSSISRSQPASDAGFALTRFEMFVCDKKAPIHHLTQLNEGGRLEDLNVNDLQAWHRQYPELAFHKTRDWRNRPVLVCDASIRILTEQLPRDAELAVICEVEHPHHLSQYHNLECRIRFYDEGKLADQYDEGGRITTQTCARMSYDPSNGAATLPFGSGFWARRIHILGKHYRDARQLDEQAARIKIDLDVRRRIQYMTAVQEIYGLRNDTNEPECALTILWRFHQTRSTEEAGRTNWRVVRFAPEQPRWVKAEPVGHVERMEPVPDTTMQLPLPSYSTLSLEFPHQGFPQHHPQHHQPLMLDCLSSMGLEGLGDFSNPQSASAPSMATDFSTHSLPSLSHSHDAGLGQSQDYHDPNDLDFTGGHINICLEPAINLGAYENYAPTPTSIHGFQPIVGYDQSHNDNSFGEFGNLDVPITPYEPKPWSCSDIVGRLEGLVEQQAGPEDHSSQGQDIAGHGVLHNGQMEHGLWKLQSPFPEDTGVGADAKQDQQLSQEHERGILNYGDRGEKFRLF